MLDQIQATGIVAVIRGANPKSILSIAKALRDGGVTTLEITVETPKVFTLIEQVATELQGEVIVGAGTVLDAETARSAILSGAQFIFSPNVDIETIKIAKRYGIVSIPGALTPTEILKAYENGGDIIKVFPASTFGPRYLKDLNNGPLPQIPLMPTGGISVDNIGEYMKYGAVAAGVGSTLVNTKEAMDETALLSLTEKAASFISEINKARNVS